MSYAGLVLHGALPSSIRCRGPLGAGAMLLAATLCVACSDSGSTEEAPSPSEIVTKVLVEGVTEGNTAVIEEFVREDYIQHGSLAPDGRAGLMAFAVLTAKIERDVHRTLVDGDRVALHSTYTFPDGTQSVVFDVFRLEGDQIAEHWDAVQGLATEPNASGRTMTDGENVVTDLDVTEQNRALVSSFVETVLKQGEWDRLSEFLSEQGHAQHNPAIADDIAGLRAFAMNLSEQGMGIAVTASPIVVAHGNFVLVGSEGTAGPVNDPQFAIFYDLFRVSGGRIVEHWDVIPASPLEANLPHTNGFF
jgi:predicted SnoaL-like aldol condensation-catalyzing enzyme